MSFKTKFTLPYLLLVLILVSSFGLMFSVSRQESAIMDELAHIPAGYSYLRYLDYRLNPEHPPLVKALAAVPLMFVDLRFPAGEASWADNVNDQWTVGNQFIYHSGNNADQIIFWARLWPILLTLLLITLIYVWAKELLGDWWGLLPAFLFALSPTVLAHGHYLTTDIGAAFGVVLATYFFIKFLLKPAGRHLIFAGLAFGTAELTKFSMALLIPYFIVLTLVWVARNRRFWRKFLSLAAVFIIGYVLVYLVYLVFTLNYPVSKQVADTQSILASVKNRLLADPVVQMAGNKILRPLAQYLLGLLMVGKRSVDGNTAYFLGAISNTGRWYYFPVVFLLKEPIPSLILIFIALLFCFWNFAKSWRFPATLKAKTYKLKAFKDYLGTHLPEFSMIVFVVFYWLYSMQSKLNIGVRHILPTLPFIYILTAGGLKNWANSHSSAWFRSRNKERIYPEARLEERAGMVPSEARRASDESQRANTLGERAVAKDKSFPLKLVLIFVLLFWFLLETIMSYPYYLSYFNQFGGGVFGGYRYVTDSNYDWGQDLKRLAAFVEEKGIQKIAVDYFGGGDTKYYFGDKAENWWPGRGNPKDVGIEWLAVSVNTLNGALAKTAPGFVRKPEDEYRWLKAIRDPYKPDFKAGTSIFIYHL